MTIPEITKFENQMATVTMDAFQERCSRNGVFITEAQESFILSSFRSLTGLVMMSVCHAIVSGTFNVDQVIGSLLVISEQNRAKTQTERDKRLRKSRPNKG